MAEPCVERILKVSTKLEPTTIKEVPDIEAFQQAAAGGGGAGGGGDLQKVVSELQQAHARMQQELEHLRFRRTESSLGA